MKPNLYVQSILNSSLSYDLDKLRTRYIERNKNLTLILPSFEISVFEKNLFIMRYYSKKYNFIESWNMRPDYTSYDFYKTTILWPLILFTNKIMNIEEYKNLDYVLIPNKDIILDLIRSRPAPDEIIDITKEYGTEPPPFLEKCYDNYLSGKKTIEDFTEKELDEYIKKLKEEFEIGEKKEEKKEEKTIIEKTEEGFLTSKEIENKEIKIKFKPVNESSVKFFVGIFNVMQNYGKDYVCIPDKKIITWKEEILYKKSTLENILYDSIKYKIIYSYDPNDEDNKK